MGRAAAPVLEGKPWLLASVPSVACPGRLLPAGIPRPTEAVEPSSSSAMLRIHGDRTSLLAALAAYWAESQLAIPAKRITTGG
jgi:hypothetical protein